MERWRAIEQHRMIFNHLFEHIPHFRLDTLNKALCTFNVMCKVLLHQLTHNKWLEQFQSHLFGQATLIQFEIWPNHNDRTTRVINALTEQILSKAALFTFE